MEQPVDYGDPQDAEAPVSGVLASVTSDALHATVLLRGRAPDQRSASGQYLEVFGLDVDAEPNAWVQIRVRSMAGIGEAPLEIWVPSYLPTAFISVTFAGSGLSIAVDRSVLSFAAGPTPHLSYAHEPDGLVLGLVQLPAGLAVIHERGAVVLSERGEVVDQQSRAVEDWAIAEGRVVLIPVDEPKL